MELNSQVTAHRAIQLVNTAGKRSGTTLTQPGKAPFAKPSSQCNSFAATGVCSYGQGCRFSHSEATPSPAATTVDVCRDYARGRCSRGADCRFSH
jgi:hypothetical protein